MQSLKLPSPGPVHITFDSVWCVFDVVHGVNRHFYLFHIVGGSFDECFLKGFQFGLGCRVLALLSGYALAPADVVTQSPVELSRMVILTRIVPAWVVPDSADPFLNLDI